MLNSDALKQLKSLKNDIVESKEIIRGIVKGSNNRFGFVTLEAGKDIYLSPDEMLKVFPGDEVEIEVKKDDKNKEFGLILKLIKSPLKKFVGKYVVKGKAHFVEVDVQGMSRWIFIPPNKRSGAKENDLIACEIIQHPIRSGKPQATILKLIGDLSKPGIEREYMIAKHQLESDWNNDTLEQTNSLTEQTLIEQHPGRTDLKALPFVTIDSASTTDMDDALFVESHDNGWTLKVAIADPTAVMATGSPLEKTAYNRMTTVYFPGEPLPMLPESISCQLCSLLPKVDRLALICEIEIDKKGSLGDYKLYEAVIHSRAKLNYEEVATFLADSSAVSDGPFNPEITPVLEQLSLLATALRQWRADNALLTENGPDYRLQLNDQKKIDSIKTIEQTDAHRLVEECMIAANRCAADFITRHKSPGLFVTHAGVRKERQSNVLDVARQRYADNVPENISDKANYVALVRQAQQDDELPPLKTIIARQLERSIYSSTPAPHCGMGLDAYTTFTSPLRKGNDFYIHRVIKKIINGEAVNLFDDAALAKLQERTINARRAVNEMEQWLKCQYMEPKKGQTYDAHIVRMTSAGFQVQLTEDGIQGFVSTKAMPVKYSYDPDLMTLTSKSKHQFQLDQPIQVTMDSVEWRRKQIHFSVVEPAKTEEKSVTEATTDTKQQ